MIRVDRSADPVIHETAQKIAGRMVWMIQVLLRPGERDFALSACYELVREELEASRREHP